MDKTIEAIHKKIQKESAFVDKLTAEVGKVIVGQKEVVEQIVVETATPMVWDNPFKDKTLDDKEISGAYELMSIVDAVRNDTEPCYSREARTDLEFYFAMIESDHLEGQEIDLPLQTRTSWEEKMREDE